MENENKENTTAPEVTTEETVATPEGSEQANAGETAIPSEGSENDGSVSNTGEGSTEANAGEGETTADTTEEKKEEGSEEDEDAEPETTLDEELDQDAKDTEVEVTGVPEGTFKPEDAPADEFLTVVNSAGVAKYTLPHDEAVENATQGGFNVREATDEEVADYEAKNR